MDIELNIWAASAVGLLMEKKQILPLAVKTAVETDIWVVSVIFKFCL